MTRIMHRAGIGVTHGAGVGVTHGAGDGLSEFPSDLADAGTAGSAAAFSVQTSDASALVTLASSIRGSDAPALCMRVLVAVSVTAWAGVSTAAAGTARPAHVRHPSCRFSRLQKEIAGRDDAERKKAIHRRSRFFRHSRVTRRGLPNPKGGAAQAIGLRDHDRHRTPGRAVQGGDHAIVVRSTRCWRKPDSNPRFPFGIGTASRRWSRALARLQTAIHPSVGPGVRIRLPPATSHTNPSKAADLLM